VETAVATALCTSSLAEHVLSALDGECACDARMSVALTIVVSW